MTANIISKKNSVLLGLFTFTLLISTYIPYSSASPTPLHEVDDMVSLLEQENLVLQEWEFITKEKVGRHMVSEIKRKIEIEFQGSSFKLEQTESAKKFTIEPHKNDSVNESFLLIVPTDINHDAELIYKLSGTIWDESIRSYYSSKLENIVNDIFSGKSTKFSCISGQTNDIISSVYLFDKIIEKLNVQPLDYIEEDNFAVLSGYTPHWKNVIPISDKPMNVQLAAREGLGGETTLTIGTPIIATEY
ncbi:hypothetical protein GH741_15030 [Aquibacillus halophilus]|uniref:TATA-box binding n=1 Tax=Aquibacillus halophilus TaxID=930132 RepID=A0A6A8DE37_9BACI|nr:YwmB family TATA-box binding protein [Aquibacillus halophilus]MRH43955.1 hypothetical protein [Aquibacillus halophilus]